MQKFDLITISNTITDLVYDVSDEILSELGLEKGKPHGSSNLTDEVKNRISSLVPVYESPAGSPANVAFNVAALGRLNVGILGTIGKCKIGRKYRKEMDRYGVYDLTRTVPKDSDVCYTFITPDKERTFLASLNAAKEHDFSHSQEVPKIVHASCYEIIAGGDAVINHLGYLKSKGADVSIDLADPEICKRISRLEEVLELTDFLFASDEEYQAAIGSSFSCYENHPFEHKVICLKYGVKGSEVVMPGSRFDVPVFEAEVVNTNGAGDAYAAGFIHMYVHSSHPLVCAKHGSQTAARVVSLMGSHLDKEDF